jgi:adenosylcobinamide-GDP ribazoletransferase
MAASAGRPDQPALLVGALSTAIPALVLLFFFGYAGVLALLMAATGVRLFSSLAERQIGGHTGDTIGAAQQIGETLLLAGLSAGWFMPALNYPHLPIG